MSEERFSLYTALDGIQLDGLIGNGGILRFDWPEKKIYFEYFDGIGAAHNVSLSPDGKLALLGNFSQQIALVDVSNPQKMNLTARQSAMYIEESPYRLRANTHHLWYPDNKTFIGAVGDHIYKFHLDDLKNPENLGPHNLYNAHELRWDKNRRYIFIADLGPERVAARQLGVFDLEQPDPKKRARVIRIPDTCWHCTVHPEKPLGYAATYSNLPQGDDYTAWSPTYTREYVFEVDLPTAKVNRLWCGGAEFPIHLNVDIEATNDHLYVTSGGSHAVTEFGLDKLEVNRVIPVVPGWWKRVSVVRQKFTNLWGGLSRAPTLINTHLVIQALYVSGGRVLDGAYGGRVSPGGKYFVSTHRGYNTISVYERATWKRIYCSQLPFRKDRFKGKPPFYRFGRTGNHLGFHHSEMVDRSGA